MASPPKPLPQRPSASSRQSDDRRDRAPVEHRGRGTYARRLSHPGCEMSILVLAFMTVGVPWTPRPLRSDMPFDARSFASAVSWPELTQLVTVDGAPTD